MPVGCPVGVDAREAKHILHRLHVAPRVRIVGERQCAVDVEHDELHARVSIHVRSSAMAG